MWCSTDQHICVHCVTNETIVVAWLFSIDAVTAGCQGRVSSVEQLRQLFAWFTRSWCCCQIHHDGQLETVSAAGLTWFSMHLFSTGIVDAFSTGIVYAFSAVKCCYDTIRYDSVYSTCSKKLTGSQLSLPHGTNKKLKCKTKNMSMIGPVQSRYRGAVQ